MAREKGSAETLERLDRLSRFAEVFTSDGFTMGAWNRPPPDNAGIRPFPFFAYSQQAEEFMKAVQDAGWIVMFDWQTWMTSAGKKFTTNRASIARASVDDLSKLLTCYFRGERFNEGCLNRAFEAGILTAIVRRAARLRDAMNTGG